MKRRQPEAELQKAVVKYIRYAAPHILFLHPANGGYRTKAEAGIFKAMGVLPGVADLLLFYEGKSYGSKSPSGYFMECAAIELKAGKGTQTEHQKAFMHKWTALGGNYAICRSISEVEAALRDWGAIQ